MNPLYARVAARQAGRLRQSCRPATRQWTRYASTEEGVAPPPPPPRRSGGGRMVSLLAVAVLSGAAVYSYPLIFNKPAPAAEKAEAKIPVAELEFEKERRRSVSKEENRELISSQHLQVKQSWENPGVYAWGSNTGRVVAPGSSEDMVKAPRRMPYFDGQILRDLKLSRDFGAALTEKGELVLWGTSFSKEAPLPTPVLKDRDLVKLAISADRVIALSSNGSVYSLPVSKADQHAGEKETASSWLWSKSTSPINYRRLTPSGLTFGERVVDVKAGQDHCVMLTSSGRVFSAAASTRDFPSKGQLGIPGLGWFTRPKGAAYDQPYEVETLRGFKIKEIAAGDYHSLALDASGRVFGFGDNAHSQLGLVLERGTSAADVPTEIKFDKLYSGTNLLPRVTSISAGGANSYFTIDATRTAPSNSAITPVTRAAGDQNSTVVDLLSAGRGVVGSLGNGRWQHTSNGLIKVASLSNLFEFNEKNKVEPIRLSDISVGADHVAATMANVTRVAAPTFGSGGRGSANDTNWGADVMWWGGNEHFQLGSGKRVNANVPTYIGALDCDEADRKKGDVTRLQITPRATVRLGKDGKGRKVSMEQRVECGRYVSAVYSGTTNSGWF